MSFQSFDLENALRRTLFIAALFNELNFISVLVGKKKEKRIKFLEEDLSVDSRHRR